MRYSAQERREANHQHQNFLAILVTAEKNMIVESSHMHSDSWAALSPHLLMLWQPSLMEVRITSTVANWLSTPRKRTRQKNTADQSWDQSEVSMGAASGSQPITAHLGAGHLGEGVGEDDEDEAGPVRHHLVHALHQSEVSTALG